MAGRIKGQWSKHKGLNRLTTCQNCGKSFIVSPYRMKIAKFCSMDCRNIAYKGRVFWTRKVNLVCQECKKVFVEPQSRLDQRFCSRLCADKGQDRSHTSGVGHWNWMGGITPMNDKVRKSISFKNWAQDVKQIWDYTCQICGVQGATLHSNHIKKFSDYPTLRFDIHNGIALCEKCHTYWVNRHEQEWESYFNFCWKLKEMEGGEN